MFQRRTSGYIIVDVAASIMFSGYFGWLFPKRETVAGEQFRGACRCSKLPASSQAERNILLWLPHVNMLWSSFFSTHY